MTFKNKWILAHVLGLIGSILIYMSYATEERGLFDNFWQILLFMPIPTTLTQAYFLKKSSLIFMLQWIFISGIIYIIWMLGICAAFHVYMFTMWEIGLWIAFAQLLIIGVILGYFSKTIARVQTWMINEQIPFARTKYPWHREMLIACLASSIITFTLFFPFHDGHLPYPTIWLIIEPIGGYTLFPFSVLILIFALLTGDKAEKIHADLSQPKIEMTL